MAPRYSKQGTSSLSQIGTMRLVTRVQGLNPAQNYARATFNHASLGKMRKSITKCNHASAVSIVAFTSLDRRRARLILPSVSSTVRR